MNLASLDPRELWDAMIRGSDTARAVIRGSDAARAVTGGSDTARAVTGGSDTARAVTGDSDEVRRLCVSDGRPRLGWIKPPPWSEVAAGISALHQRFGGPIKDLVVLGTGGWAFAAQALGGNVVGLDSLDPARIRAAMEVSRNFLAVSESGTTLETRRLAEAVAGHGRLVWLSGELRDHVAMLGAPLSPAFLYPASIVDDSLEDTYEAFRSRHEEIALTAVGRAVATQIEGPVAIALTAPPWAGPGLRRWLLQLGRQVLCGKSRTFRPSIPANTETKIRAFAGQYAVRQKSNGAFARQLPGSWGADGSWGEVGTLMDAFYAAGIFVGALALRAGLDVCAHPNVRAYKELLGPDDAPMWTHGEAERWLERRPDLKRVHVVFYGSAPFGVPTKKVEIHEGSAWNHHSFQAVYADPETAVLLVVGDDDTGGTLRRIAIATHRALPGRSALIRAGEAA